VRPVAIPPADLNPHPDHGDHATSNRLTMVIMQPPTWSWSRTGLSGSPLRVRTRALLNPPHLPSATNLNDVGSAAL
jgi:hypothetical protein